ncbi:hypothetical protein [Flavobacterium sp.]|uniref:hypothetical protein n=1 Tax=Flavobacterium sp. TaxID=239 RepID=UPI003A91C31C
MKNKPRLKQIVSFLESIGIEVAEGPLTATTFLPGLELGPNVIYVDFDKLKHPGDILHEAGHIAVTESSQRQYIGTGKMPEDWPNMGDEIAAIAWSAAVAQHLDIPLSFVFHPAGYKGASDWHIENFSNGNYIGLPLLQWMGIAYNDTEIQNGHPPFPAFKSWLRP